MPYDMRGFYEYLTTECKYSKGPSIASSRRIKKLMEFYGDKDITNRDVEEMVVCVLGHRPVTRTIRSWRYALNKYKDYLLYLGNDCA